MQPSGVCFEWLALMMLSQEYTAQSLVHGLPMNMLYHAVVLTVALDIYSFDKDE